MARSYKPYTPFSVPMKLLVPTESNVKGTIQKTFPDPENAPLIYGSFRTFGGTETTVNGLYVVEDTATIDTWYRDDITSNCRLQILPHGTMYEIVGTPENIEMRNQYLHIRVKKVGGGA